MSTIKIRKNAFGIVFCCLAAVLAFAPAYADSASAPAVSSVPVPAITTNTGPVGQLLKKWAAEGTAAGNTDDWYDNRDRGHSMLDLKPFPQLRLHPYSDSQKQIRADWALAVNILPKVVFGNSSTSAPAFRGGSNPLMCYVVPEGLQLLYDQYRNNNLYMYPAHQDYRPPTLQDSGFGDLYPANTPYVIISHGSSGSDQPFMQAVAFTLAAFQPQVKTKLVDNGLLMPTIQMIFRMSNKQVKEPQDYFTGKAHPPVFEGPQVDTLKMIELAHQIDPAHIPPLVRLKVVEEDHPVVYRDYMDPVQTDHLGDTACVIARLYRTTQPTHRLVVSAETSQDINHLPLTYRWVLLRGDPAKVKITPRNPSGSVAEIVISYHEKTPISPGADMSTNRVDIGVFVNNGTYWSAPGFVTSYTLDNEARTYDAQGRPLEIGYNMGSPSVNITSWPTLFQAIAAQPLKPGVKLLLAGLSEKQIAAIGKVAEKYKDADAKVDEADKKRKDADADWKKAAPDKKKEMEAAAKAAQQVSAAAVKARDEALTAKPDELPQGVKPLIESSLKAMIDNPAFYSEHAADFVGVSAVEPGRKRLAGYGIISEKPDKSLEFLPLLAGDKPASERLSAYQKAQMKRFNAELLAAAIPGLYPVYRVNQVDFRLTLPKNWRDVYHYAQDGTRTGWTRYDGTGSTEFNSDGHIVIKRDEKGRCILARKVKYERNTPAKFDPTQGPDPTPLSFTSTPQEVVYEYANDQDYAGHIKRTEGAESRPAEK